MSKQNNLRVYEPDTPQYRFYKEQHAKPVNIQVMK